MNTYLSVLILFGFLSLTSFENANAEGPIRKRIKAKVTQKLNDQPAPVVSDIKGEITKPGTYTFSIPSGEYTRYYILHVPPKYSAKTNHPLVLALHGGGGNMSIQSDDQYYGLKAKADKEGYLIAFPNGYSKFPSGQLATWNAGTCCGGARDKKIDDVAFIKALVKNIQKQVKVDSNRVFAMGMSNGAMMTYRLACEAPELFKGIVAVAGTDNVLGECKPSKSVSILHIHAKDDDHVPYEGGQGVGTKKFGDKTAPLFVSVPQTIKKWVGHYSCLPTPTKILEKPKAMCELYRGCSGGAKIQLCTVDNGGHSWPGASKKPHNMGTAPSNALNANDVSWDFFRSL